MTIHFPDGTSLDVILTKEAEHEEELMKGDFVRLSWLDVSWYTLPVGSYIVPFTDVLDVAGAPAKFTLYKEFVPDDTPNGYSYKPEFQHPKMWLGYVPFLFETQDASGATVKKTDHTEVGRLSTVMDNLCGFMNEVLGLTVDNGNSGSDNDSTAPSAARFIPVYSDVDPSQTVSVHFSDNDVLSAIGAVANAVGCEWHLDWQLRLLYFGRVKTGVTPYPLVVDVNVKTPAVTRSKDGMYNRYIVQGSSRNNVRETSNGWQATGTRLTLPDEYSDSIIDLRRISPHRPNDTFVQGRENEPALTGVMTLDDVYPHLDLYLYDIRERKKWKTDGNGNLTKERWSVWYTKLAYFDTNNAESIGSFTKGGVLQYWHEYKLDGLAKAHVMDFIAQSNDDGHGHYTFRAVRLDLPWNENLFNGTETSVIRGSGQDQYSLPCREVTVVVGGTGYSLCAAETNMVTMSDGTPYTSYLLPEDYSVYLMQKTTVAGQPDVLSIMQALYDTEQELTILFSDGVNKKAFPTTHIDSRRVDGLAPSFAFRVNEADGAAASPMGTREFEVNYLDDEVEFDKSDDMERPEGASLLAFGYKGDTLPAGYYEIIHTEEGSDKLIMPTTQEQGIVPTQSTSLPSLLNNTGFLFNIAPDGVMMEQGRQALLTEALKEVAVLFADTNNYTFDTNPVAFAAENPRLTIGRTVCYKAYGYEVETRVLKMVTKVDHPFEQSITVGNKILKGANTRLREEIASLRGEMDGWSTQGLSISTDREDVVVVEYEAWQRGGLYYHEDLNRFHVDADGKVSPIIEQSVVWHKGCKWKCLRTLTPEEPSWKAVDWQFLEGNATITMEFDSGGVTAARPGYVHIDVTPHVFFGYVDDISLDVLSWTWERITENEQADIGWTNAHQNQRTLQIRNEDMPATWAVGNPTRFRCTATLPDSTHIVNEVII